MDLKESINIVIYTLALLSVAILYWKQRSMEAGLLVSMMIGVIVAETIGALGIGHGLLRVNLVILFQFLLLLLVYQYLVKWRRGKRIVRFFILLFLLSWVICVLTIQPIMETLVSYSYSIGALGILITILIYFYEQLVLSKTSNSMYNNFFSVTSAGLFIWLATELPIFASFNYIIENNLTVEDLPWLNLKIYASLVFYLSFPLAILLWKKAD